MNTIEKAKNIFILGIKGVAMAHLAIILSEMGKHVTGADVDEIFKTDVLLQIHNLKVQIGFDPQTLPKETDLVIYSAAHGGLENPLIQEAKKRNVTILSQGEVLGELSSYCKHTIAICGTHGKTTTSSMLAYALIKLGVKPSFMVGTPKFNEYEGSAYGDKEYFVIEADEYGVNPPLDKAAKFLFLNPDTILCTNIDFDHPDVYDSLDTVKDTFRSFFTKANNLIVCGDDINALETAKHSGKKFKTYGFSEKNDIQIKEFRTTSDGTELTLLIENKPHKFYTTLWGEKNSSNTAGVISVLLQYGFSSSEIQKAIQYFTGAQRRFELLYKTNDIFLFDDYAHHPAEIKATIESARRRYPNKILRVIFQPHTFSRTKMFLKEFAEALVLADTAYILPVFSSAREKGSEFNVTSQDIVAQAKILGKTNIQTYDTKEGLLEELTKVIGANEVIFTMGAGNVYELGDDIIKVIHAHHTEKR
ncbi:MAG: UDP-N-acetylmuramate--L-alanine ligase [Patescibacteria group bacterium]